MEKKLAHGFNTTAQGSNPGSRSRENVVREAREVQEIRQWKLRSQVASGGYLQTA